MCGRSGPLYRRCGSNGVVRQISGGNLLRNGPQILHSLHLSRVEALLARCDLPPQPLSAESAACRENAHRRYAFQMAAVSPKERQRRSDLAKRLHREGKLGGRAAGLKSGAVRARRASELSQRLVEKHQDDIEKALVDALKHGSRSQKIRASESLLKLALASERLDVAEHRDEQQHRSREELLDLLADKLNAATPAAQLIPCSTGRAQRRHRRAGRRAAHRSFRARLVLTPRSAAQKPPTSMMWALRMF